jgi:aminopeptidase N
MDNILNIWPVSGNYNVNENSFVSEDIYPKGAIILHNLRCIINNDEVFMKLLKDYFQKYKYKSINADAFIKMAGSYSGMNLEPFFHKFLYDTDPPVLSYNIFYEKDSDIILAYKWNNVEPGFTMPFSVADNKNKAYALSGTSSKSFTRFENIEFIKFITQFPDDKDTVVPVKNSFTYYRTKLDADLKL